MSVPNDEILAALSSEVGARLLAAHRVLATAESCTGGWIAKLCTDIAGSSDWFDCGFVCYSNAAKSRDLGVPEKLIESEGSVSDAVVRAMAEGALARTGANVAIPIFAPIMQATQVPCGSLVEALAPGSPAPGTKFSPPMTRPPSAEAELEIPLSIVPTTTP